MRLQRFLSDVGFCSRREAEELIAAGKIRIDGKKAILGDKVKGQESIVVDGKPLPASSPSVKKVIAFHKPLGVECTMQKSPWLKTLMDFDFGPDRVFPVGSLEKDAHGLLLLTNDGKLGNILAMPDTAREEEYIVMVKEPLVPEKLAQLKEGITLKNKEFTLHKVTMEKENVFQCVLRGGKPKYIRKICSAFDLEVVDLQRTRIGSIRLGEILPGQWSSLNEKDLQSLKESNAPKTREPQRRIIKKR
ncbi:MAG: pseudouridine synthase [Desulfopila sp.]|jgi:pseudouridine synthase|nr:pseudouridine synthase [Desulfopila sp.]